MAFDFPNAPTLNQIATAPNGSYRWDGIKWVTTGTGGFLALSGGTVTGAVTFGSTVTLAADPTTALQASTKQYADRVPPVIATIAALRLATSTTLASTQCMVHSYTGTTTKGGGRFVYVSGDTTTLDNGGTVIVDASSRRWYREGGRDDALNVAWFGALGDGTTNDTTAFTNAFNAMRVAGGVVYVPTGKYVLASNIAVAMGAGASFSMFGDGQELTQLIWAAGGGLTLTLPSETNSVHVRDMSFLTGADNIGTGLAINLTITTLLRFPDSPPSDITNVTFRGTDGMIFTHHWHTCLAVDRQTQITFDNVMCAGYQDAAVYSRDSSVGVSLTATSGVPGVVYNFDGCTFNNMGAGLSYGNWIQGVACVNCNFTGCAIGINAPALTGEAQLSIANSQFNCVTSINLQTAIFAVQIVSSLFIVPNTGAAIQLVGAAQLTIVGNSFGAAALSQASGAGIVIAAGAQLGGNIADNSFWNLPGVGINMASGSGAFAITGNAFVSVGTPISDLGSGSVISNNFGIVNGLIDWGPQITASPWTHQTGSRTENLTFYSTGTLQMIDSGGVFLLGGAVTANTNVFLSIPPWTTIKVTYLGTLTCRGIVVA